VLFLLGVGWCGSVDSVRGVVGNRLPSRRGSGRLHQRPSTASRTNRPGPARGHIASPSTHSAWPGRQNVKRVRRAEPAPAYTF